MAKAQFLLVTVVVVCALVDISESSQQLKTNIENALSKMQKNNVVKEQTPCTCGVFLTGQFKKGSTEPPKGNPALILDQDIQFQCNPAGLVKCRNRCLETIVQHMNSSPAIICGTYLFVQNCNATWINTNLSAGREYCCKDGAFYHCPLV